MTERKNSLSVGYNNFEYAIGAKEIIPPLSVGFVEKSGDDPYASECKIPLYKLVDLLESLKGKDIPKTIVLGLYVPEIRQGQEPSFEEMREKVIMALEIVNGQQERSIEHYDAMALAYWDKENPTACYSAYNTLYPVPAFLEGCFDIDSDTCSVGVGDFADYFLRAGYCDRVILVPRIRYKGGDIESEFNTLFFEHLIISEDSEWREKKGILPGEDIFDLALLDDQVFKEANIPVLRKL